MLGALAAKSMFPKSVAERAGGPAIWDELLEMAPQLLASIVEVSNPRRYLTLSDARAALEPIWSVVDSMLMLHRAISQARMNPVHGTVTTLQPDAQRTQRDTHRYHVVERFLAALSAFQR